MAVLLAKLVNSIDFSDSQGRQRYTEKVNQLIAHLQKKYPGHAVLRSALDSLDSIDQDPIRFRIVVRDIIRMGNKPFNFAAARRKQIQNLPLQQHSKEAPFSLLTPSVETTSHWV